MKYFNPSYWFKLWLLSAPLFNDKTQGINAKSIDNKKIKDWASNNTSLEAINQEISYTNSSNNYQSYNLSETNKSINPIYQTELETSTHKHRHEKSRNRHKRQYIGGDYLRDFVIPEAKATYESREKEYINNLDPRISFLGSDMQQKGVLWLDTWAKRIKFYPKTDYYGKALKFGTYKNIVINDNNNNLVRIITFNQDNFMSDVLNAHNLNSKKVPNDGLDYKDGYTIEITSSQPKTTQVKRNECCKWWWYNIDYKYTEKLTIINDWLWHKDYYQEKYFSLLSDWNTKVKYGRTDSYQWILQHLHDYKQNIQIIKNQIAIDNLKTEISKIYKKISELETQIRNLQNKSINAWSACSSTAGAINNINGALKIASASFSFIPVFGQGISTVISLTNSACSLANAFGRKRRDVSIIENKLDDNIINSINQEKNLPLINNFTNDLVNNKTNFIN